MKVVRVKAKIARPSAEEVIQGYAEELASARAQIMELKQKNAQLENDLDIEKRNHTLALAGVQVWQAECNKLRQEIRARNARITQLERALRVWQL